MQEVNPRSLSRKVNQYLIQLLEERDLFMQEKKEF